MKKKFSKFLLGFVCAMSLLAISFSAQSIRVYIQSDNYPAYYCDRWGNCYRNWQPNYYQPQYVCKWKGGFWKKGRWHPAKKVCWYR